jgi:hypothetical protein
MEAAKTQADALRLKPFYEVEECLFLVRNFLFSMTTPDQGIQGVWLDREVPIG